MSEEPTRPWRRATAWMRPARVAQAGLEAGPEGPGPAAEADDEPCGAGIGELPAGLYRMVSGVDREAVPVPEEQAARLGDPMATLFLRQGRFPVTVTELLDGLPPGLPAPQVYLVGEAGRIDPAEAPELPRDLRFAIACKTRGSAVDLLVSTGAGGDPAQTFLQVAAWDQAAGLFNYYLRIGPAWIWAGDSWSALEEPSRGKGCFDSHVNGSVVMKELKAPWANWRSMAADILLAPDDPLRRDPLYRSSIGAETLELTVRALVSRWTAARVRKVSEGGTVDHPDRLLRHLFTSTTVNLASSAVESAQVRPGGPPLTLPVSFWLNADVLLDVLGLPLTVPLPQAPPELYRRALAEFGFRLAERSSGFSRPGDTFFAFPYPEPALEDNDVVRHLLARGLVSERFASCALMLDFPNPVFSADRARLMAYVPAGPVPSGELGERTAAAVVAAAAGLPTDSPEARFAADWALPEDERTARFGARLDAYLQRVTELIATEQGFFDYVRLAESRRRSFRALRLNEFELTLPVTDIPATDPPRLMREDGTVVAQAQP
ncbi:hypothetical protein ACWGB8_11175 [Kitasatospora sp. NPDC054939]